MGPNDGRTGGLAPPHNTPQGSGAPASVRGETDANGGQFWMNHSSEFVQFIGSAKAQTRISLSGLGLLARQRVYARDRLDRGDTPRTNSTTRDQLLPQSSLFDHIIGSSASTASFSSSAVLPRRNLRCKILVDDIDAHICFLHRRLRQDLPSTVNAAMIVLALYVATRVLYLPA
ncbi:hypothetical protein GGR54DRAFT_651462 [Hypoxylon sp. NC1633]|nr:hypothetical protein GGR54DRAFT_651462 [Hypoxylon sp. NC1633]